MGGHWTNVVGIGIKNHDGSEKSIKDDQIILEPQTIVLPIQVRQLGSAFKLRIRGHTRAIFVIFISAKKK